MGVCGSGLRVGSRVSGVKSPGLAAVVNPKNMREPEDESVAMKKHHLVNLSIEDLPASPSKLQTATDSVTEFSQSVLSPECCKRHAVPRLHTPATDPSCSLGPTLLVRDGDAICRIPFLEQSLESSSLFQRRKNAQLASPISVSTVDSGSGTRPGSKVFKVNHRDPFCMRNVSHFHNRV